MENKKSLVITANKITKHFNNCKYIKNTTKKSINNKSNFKLTNDKLLDKRDEKINKLVTNVIHHEYRSNIPIM